MNEVVEKKEKNPILDLQNTNKLCKMLMEQPHYKRMGQEGIFAIVQKAQSLGLNPLEALNGGMYFVQGKVEMQSILMSKMIRAKGHSITMGKESDKKQCVLHGRRKDNGDTWKVVFTIEDAKRAGIYKENGPWGKYPEDMLYNRALSRLARQLFSDVIGNCYVEGEISEAPPLEEPVAELEELRPVEKPVELEKITEDEFDELNDLIGEDADFREKILGWLEKRFEVRDLKQMPRIVFDQVKQRALANFEKNTTIEMEA